ncbi:phage head-binding domain-containing protein [Proteus columbae]|uniref:phage head-binding domain-containing protein n=1 Tax=Proteus columbae TaxID=1987580 RepID=UPI002889742D|nr:phage head-binding domain-containing protein [Proteus columbae]
MADVIPNVVISMPSQQFTLARKFQAASNGKIYIGKIDSDPTLPENQIQVYLENEDGSHIPVPQPLIINQAGFPVYNGQIAKFVTVEGHSMAVYDSYGAQQHYYTNVLKYDPDQLRQELESSAGASLVNTTAGMSVQKYIDGLTLTTKQLNITNSDQLISALDEHGAIIVNSDVIIDKYTIIPSHSNVINGGGLFRLVNSDSCISIRPNVKFDCDVSITPGVNLSVSVFHIDGKIDNPRWYVADHDTYIKSNVRSDDIDGVCLFLDAISELGKRALISGLRADINLYRMKTGVLAKTDGRKITSGNTYITSNTIKITASGTRTILEERYSSDLSNGEAKPKNEEIGGNIYQLEHQPTIDTEYKLIRLDGRMNRLTCNLWDTEYATNNDVIVINGHDNVIIGPNLPSINSKYVQINGLRCTYMGYTYGIPELKIPIINCERGLKFGLKGDFKGYGIIYLTQTPREIQEAPVTILSKSVAIEEFRRPYAIKLESFTRLNLAEYISKITIGNISFDMNRSSTGGDVFHVINILISESQVHIISIINNSVTSSSYTASLIGNTIIKFEISRKQGSGTNFYNILTGGTDNI